VVLGPATAHQAPRLSPPPAAESLSNLQNDLPALTDFDKQAIGTLCK
jgi:hypothetical protein